MDKIEIKPPLREDNPRIPSPWGDEIFYYPQVDLIKEAVKGKQWRWCEVRPDQIIGKQFARYSSTNGYSLFFILRDQRLTRVFTSIIGHVPAVTSMTYVEPLALYLSLYRYVHGPGAVVPFPGTQKNFVYTYTDSSQDIITRAEIYLSVVKPEAANGEAFNIADTATQGPWSVKWPILAGYFDLKGTGPGAWAEKGGWGEIDVWWNEHQDAYVKMCAEFGLQKRTIEAATWIFVKAGLTLLDRNREMSLDKIRKVGFTEELLVGEGHLRTFDRIAAEGIIPPRSAWA
jgi:hypothetical protein